MAVHDMLCPPTNTGSSMDAGVEQAEEIRHRIALLKTLTGLLHQCLAANYYALVEKDHETKGWNAQYAEIQSLFAACDATFSAQPIAGRKVRMAWKKLKRDLIMFLRDQKKYLVPKMLRFQKGEVMIAAQLASLELLDQSGHLAMVMEEVARSSQKAELLGVMNVLRSSPQHNALYRKSLELVPSECRNVLPDQNDVSLSWHPKFAGVPFMLKLSIRVMLDDLNGMVNAANRALKGLGELPTTDIRNTFEIFYAHFISHKAIVFEPVVESLEAQSVMAEYNTIEPQMDQLEQLICRAEKAPGLERRPLLEETLVVARQLQSHAARFFGDFSATYVPVCVTAFSYEQSMELFGRIVQTYHSASPHLLCRTIASLVENEEYEFFCRNILSVPFALLKDVLDTVRAEVPTRIWLRVTDTMTCLAGVTLDSVHWSNLANAGGVALFWKLTHRHLESEMAGVLLGINERTLTPGSFVGMLNTTQNLMMYLEKHGNFEDEFLLPRIACAVPTIAEASYEDTANEHALLESNELRVISILKASFKCVQQQSNVVPLRQVNRMKRQLRSYQTLILPHLCKEEEKYMPIMLYRFSTLQFQVLFHHLFVLYGKLMSDEFLVALMRLATPLEQRRFFLEFVPSYLKFRSLHAATASREEMVFPKADFFYIEELSVEKVVLLCSKIQPKLWAMLQRNFPHLVKPVSDRDDTTE